MSLSGNFDTSTVYSSVANITRYYTIEWTATQSVPNNTTTVSWTITHKGTGSGKWYGEHDIKFTIGGVTAYTTGSTVVQRYLGTVATGTTAVPHNADGTKKALFHFEAKMGGTTVTSPNLTGDATWTFDKIPRASSIKCPTLTMGTAGTITVTKEVSRYTHTITAYWGDTTSSGISSGKGYKWTVCTKSSSTSVSITAPTANLAPIIPNNTAGVGTLVCDTYDGSTLVGTYKTTFIANIPSSVVPSFTSLSTAYVNNTVPSDWNLYIKGKSQCKLTITGASGIYGSTIKSYEIKQGSDLLSSSTSVTTGVLNTVGLITYTAKITDSRGRTASKTASINVVDYSNPKINSISSQRCLLNGTVDDDGTYIKCTCSFTIASCSGKNTSTPRIWYRKVGDTSWSSAISFTNGTAIIFGGGNIDVNYSYEVWYQVNDSFTKTSVVEVVMTTFTTMDFKHGGKGVAVGKVSEDDGIFDIGLITRPQGGFEFPEYETGNLNNFTTPNNYGLASLSGFTNAPTVDNTAVSATLEVFPSGVSGELVQRMTISDKNNPKTFVRHKYGGSWGAWKTVYCIETVTLTDDNFELLKYARSGKVCTVYGKIKATTATVTLTDVVPHCLMGYAFSPRFSASSPYTPTTGSVWVTTGGNLTVYGVVNAVTYFQLTYICV